MNKHFIRGTCYCPNPMTEFENKILTTEPPESPAEHPLRTAIRNLNRSRAGAIFADRPLGDFWKPGLLRSPFEEDLTIRQLKLLPIESLLQKRSFSEAKIQAILAAIEGCREAAELWNGDEVESQLRSPLFHSEHQAQATKAFPGRQDEPRVKDEGKLKSVAAHPLASGTILRLEEVADPHLSLVSRIAWLALNVLDSKLLQILVLLDYLSDADVARILGCTKKEIDRNLAGFFEEPANDICCDPLLSGVVQLLQSAVVVSPYRMGRVLSDCRSAETSVVGFASSLLYRAGRLRPLTIIGEQLRSLFAFNQKRVELHLNGVTSMLPMSEEDVRQCLDFYFPLISPDEQRFLLNLVAEFDGVNGYWDIKDKKLSSIKHPRRRKSSVR